MIGYSLALLIGLTLGLLGGGGSILTVPILVYLLKMDPKQAIALSLAIVGITSLIGVFRHAKVKNVDYKVAALFAPIAMIGTFGGAKISQFLTGEIQLLFFGIIMLLASIHMFKGKKEKEEEISKTISYPLLTIQAIIVGIITGIVGVGGGFLIVPALVLLAGLSMKKAVGTSLLIISLNSLSGFIGHIGIVEIPWSFLFKFTAFSGIGIIIGSYLSDFVPQQKLKKIFAIFLICVGSFIVTR
jgi:uncharacterized membrane protein YfcA